MTGRHLLPSELDVRDPNFARQCLSWAHEAHRDMEELIARTTATIEESSALLEHLDRLLSWRLGGATEVRAEWHFGGDGSERDRESQRTGGVSVWRSSDLTKVGS